MLVFWSVTPCCLVDIPVQNYVVQHLTNTWHEQSPSRNSEVPHFLIHVFVNVTSR
jgi:hypothetical protein